MTSLCDKCYAPGACCKGFTLTAANGDFVTFWLDEDINAQLAARGLPFEVTIVTEKWLDQESGRGYGAIEVACPKVTPEGRCSIYEDRPQLCRDFPPRGNALCVHFHMESGDASMGFFEEDQR